MRTEIDLGPGQGVTIVTRMTPAPGPVVRFAHLRLRRAEVRLRVPPHRHTLYEALIPLRGHYHCRIEGEAWEAQPGEALLVRPGEVHADDAPGPLLLAAVAFSVVGRLRWNTERRMAWPEGRAWVTCLMDQPDDDQTAIIADARCRELLAYFRRAHAPQEPPFTVRLTAELEQRLTQPLDLAGLATALGVARRTLSIRCREATGTSPARFLQQLRLERARALLTETDFPIRTVAGLAGFANPNHFTTCYRRHFGHPPRAEGGLPAE